MDKGDKMIDLVLIDIDGTLMNDEKTIPEENIQAIEWLLSKNIPVTLVTGRSYHTCLDVIDKLKEDVPVVFQNGALIYQPYSGKILRQVFLSEHIVKEVIGYTNHMQNRILYLNSLHQEDMWTISPYKGPYEIYFQRNSTRVRMVNDFLSLPLHEVTEIVLLDSEKEIQKAIHPLVKNYSGLFSPIKSFEIQDEIFFEVFGQDVSKGKAAQFLADYFHVSLQNTLFIGDSYNDEEIMELVGYPVAMGNAVEEVKTKARMITKTNNEAGVAWAIHELIKN